MLRWLFLLFSIVWSSLLSSILAGSVYDMTADKWEHYPGGLAVHKNNSLHLIIKDHLTNTRAIVMDGTDNCAGSMGYQAQYDYYPYSKILRKQENPRSRFQSTDHETDLETGYNNRNARWYDDESFQFLNVDKFADKYSQWSPYHYVARNPISILDPTGDNWFNYQAEGEGESSWHWAEGDKTTYKNKDGKEVSMTSNYEYLAKYEVGGTNAYGAATGTLYLYHQNDLIVKENFVFSGGGWWTSDGLGSKEPLRNYVPIGEGNYKMNLGKRDDGSLLKNGSSEGPNRFMGIQLIPPNTINSGGYNVSENYGGGRIYLMPFEGKSRDLYLHGKEQWYNRRTHGCVCDKDESVFNYFWSGNGKDYRGIVPFNVNYSTIPNQPTKPTFIDRLKDEILKRW